MNGPLVLVVDDDRSIREFLMVALELEGYLVIGAIDGREALDWLNSCSPVVILLDLQMPIVDGRAVLRALEVRAARPGVIVMSSESRFLEWCGQSSADACLAKPFSVAELLETVDRVQRAA